MEENVQLIVSLVEPEQPASGFPTIPTINIAATSTLHQLTQSDFDLPAIFSKKDLLDLISKVANGELTKSEINQTGEIIAPRMVRSV